MNQFISFTKPNGDKCTYHYSRIVGYEQVGKSYTDLMINFCGEEKIVRVDCQYSSVHNRMISVKAAV